MLSQIRTSQGRIAFYVASDSWNLLTNSQQIFKMPYALELIQDQYSFLLETSHNFAPHLIPVKNVDYVTKLIVAFIFLCLFALNCYLFCYFVPNFLALKEVPDASRKVAALHGTFNWVFMVAI